MRHIYLFTLIAHQFERNLEKSILLIQYILLNLKVIS